ncbi:Glucans biosynthesis protein G precursor [Thioalkalivibrio nitratireducens DSM 14787]|uniref:Glucans biosynthesis protein G n=1 Tax=Thioalkalivibrio nitratireducens (strain DSM 14787 / UNIQEM 213 / ALEN2) TaxID=1255043 RepID=L0DVC9_THIND|nr:glucan biosynthesis protein [Thioalkalivibrio nitratireducens]AGA32962.1 Glucans biosynthesis protein G precursor [Thioalkalivibrio nitratireducens DSM 14787]
MTGWRRWIGLVLAVAWLAIPAHGAWGAASPSNAQVETLFEQVAARARAAAGSPYQAPQATLPEPLAEITYDQYRSIRFRPEKSLWRGEARFEVQFFHPGFLFRHPVSVYELRDGAVREVAFDPAMFRYDGDASALAGVASRDPGFAGFRLHFPINTESYKDEVMVFLGASYFRLVGPGQVYGLSSRGIAIDTAEPAGEEFPAFRAFWLVRPESGADTVTVLALLDGPSVAGAYRFDLHVGAEVTVSVDKRLFAREDVRKLGVAPLTSMYFFGDASVRAYDDFRPRVHDSEGLMKHGSTGEWLWRPLSNPRYLRVSSLRDERPRGFGLVQRRREFGAYLDLEAEYHRRPSQWVVPLGGDWGRGGVELIEIPTDSETHDNVVAFWAGDRAFRRGDRREYRYRLVVFDDRPPGQPPARVTRTRSGWGAVPGVADSPPRTLRRFIVDFADRELEQLPAGAQLEPRIDARSGKIDDLRARRLPDGSGWRASFLLAPEGGRPSDLRLALLHQGRPVTETWTYVWYPDER